VIIFVLAISAIFWFPDLDVGSFAPRSSTNNEELSIPIRQKGTGGELLLQDQVDWRGGKKEPVLVESGDEGADPWSDPLVGGGGERLGAEDPLIKSIEKLRASLKDNYVVE